jgi:hypothetical protein
MSSISSIETSFYPGLIEGFSPQTTQAIPAVQREEVEDNAAKYYQGGGSSGENSDVDLSNYYSDIRPEDLLAQAGRNVSQSAEALDNAMVSAIENGLGVNEACNIKLAEMAYRANAYMFKTAAEVSTFMLKV